MWEYIKAALYGALEGVTEWLPISSTGHLIIFGDALMPTALAELGDSFVNMLHVLIQLFAILAVIFTYPKELIPIGRQRKKVFGLWWLLILATIPAALIGLFFDKLSLCLFGKELDSLLFTPTTVASALIVYGILFIIVERFTKNSAKKCDVSPKTALGIGIFQALAIVPGTSRSGATILGARILGLSRESASRFSFFAAIPVIGAASILKLSDLFSPSLSLCGYTLSLMLTAGFVSFAVSMLTLKILTGLVRKHSFIPFGIYRILLGIAILLF